MFYWHYERSHRQGDAGEMEEEVWEVRRILVSHSATLARVNGNKETRKSKEREGETSLLGLQLLRVECSSTHSSVACPWDPGCLYIFFSPPRLSLSHSLLISCTFIEAIGAESEMWLLLEFPSAKTHPRVWTKVRMLLVYQLNQEARELWVFNFQTHETHVYTRWKGECKVRKRKRVRVKVKVHHLTQSTLMYFVPASPKNTAITRAMSNWPTYYRCCLRV